MSISLPPLPTPIFSIDSESAQKEMATGTEAHLWRLNTNQFTAAHFAEAAQIMSSHEQERAQKMVRGKETYIASRWLLRKVLSRYTSQHARDVEILRTDKGKPYLAHSNIHFSLSHSGHWAVLAIATSDAVGIDIEATKATRNLAGIAEHYYHPQEFAQLQTLTGDAQYDYFYRLWTLKEAFFKATGTGISAGLDKIHFSLDNDEIQAEIATDLNKEKVGWQFHQWALTTGDESTHNYCALAYSAPYRLAVRWFDALAAPAFS